MSITAPLTTESELDEAAGDEITIVVGDEIAPEILDSVDLSVAVEPLEVEDEETSLLRDPLLPFLVVGSIAFVALIVLAYMISSASFIL